MKSIRVHRIGFFEPKPHAIRSLSYDRKVSRLSVSRADSTIEIWDVSQKPFLEKVIPGSPSLSVETLAWCNGRLFSAGFHGDITEYDLSTLLPKYHLTVTSGSPIWCIAPNKDMSFLAVGNEDGHVVLHELSTEALNFEKKFDKQEGCILCLDWSFDGQFIVTGSLDAIRVWNVKTGHAVNRILLSRLAKNTPTVVWCIAITRDMTIISGDSCGKTSFWDGNTGTLLTAIGSQKEDILSLTVSENEDEIYTSGVNPTITMFMKSQSNGKWMKSVQRVVHTHDVRALQLVGDFLVSGGDDCSLLFTKYPPKTNVRFFPFCQKPHAVTASEVPCILLQYPDCLKVFGIESNLITGEIKNPTELMKVSPNKNESIICSSISANGKWIAYSSQYKIRLFSVKMNEDSVPQGIHKTALPDRAPSSASILQFTADSSKLICYSKNVIFIFNCNSTQIVLETVLDEKPELQNGCHLMNISPDGSFLACASSSGSIFVYSLNTLKVICTLPLYKCQATAIKFDPLSENLISTYCDRKVVEYNIKKLQYSTWSKQKCLLELQVASHHPITSICFFSNNLFLQDESAIYIIDRLQQDQPAKKLKSSAVTEVTVTEGTYRTVTKYEHISSLHSIKEDLVVVEINSNHILDSLPPPVWKKKYGT